MPRYMYSVLLGSDLIDRMDLMDRTGLMGLAAVTFRVWGRKLAKYRESESVTDLLCFRVT